MNKSVYIRPLNVEDAKTSYKWRNNPKIWRMTGFKPDRHITWEIETEWIIEVLQRRDERRFAICCAKTDAYIGNVYLTNISNGSAQLHIFIGEIQYWGAGRASTATMLALEHAFLQLGLKEVYMVINRHNLASISLAKSRGFKLNQSLHKHLLTNDALILYVLDKQTFLENLRIQNAVV